MKNKFLKIAFLILNSLFTIAICVSAQQPSAVSFKTGISVVFQIIASSPDASQKSFGGVYFTGYNQPDKENLVHRVLSDRTNRMYFGYDLIIERDSAAPDKFKVSIKPLSIKPPEHLGLNDLTALSLPKYPSELIVSDGDSIALDILVNPQTKVSIADFIKITTRKPNLSDDSMFSSTANGSGANSSQKPQARDFTLNDVRLRLTSPKFLVNGVRSPLSGSNWEGIIEGSIINVYLPGKGRFIFSLFPRGKFDFRKNAMIEDNKIVFQSNNEHFEIVCEAPIVNGGGNWNLWTFFDSSYRPDLVFSAEAGGYLEYGSANEVEALMQQEWRKSRILPIRPPQDQIKIYQKWLEEVRYIMSEAENKAFSGLKTDDEREQFITSFWQRRDPKPETKLNEFRKEFYERMAAANENFSFGTIPGWKTDRGRILIIHGKPDEIQKTNEAETWIYKSLAGLGNNVRFEFVKSDSGDYRLRS